MRKKIVSAGHICLDITPVFDPGQKVDAKELFLPGRLNKVGTAELHPGGSVFNTGLAFQFFGSDVTMMAKAGADSFGKMISDIISGFQVQDKISYSDTSDTSYSIVIAPPGIDRIFFHCSGANDEFGYEDIDFHVVGEADLFHFGYPTLMRRMYQNPKEMIRIFRQVREAHTLTSLDLAAVADGAEAALADWRAIFRELLPYVDYFVPSAEELCFLIDRERYREWMKRANGRDVTEILSWEKDIRPLAEQVLAWGARAVLIKCGASGMYLRTGEMEGSGLPNEEEWNRVELFERSYRADRFCSGTGAGDVSIAAFLTAMLNGLGPRRCLQLAAGAGACCVSSYDALGGLIPLQAMEQRIDEGWQKM